jgi:hypothetical protein
LALDDIDKFITLNVTRDLYTGSSQVMTDQVAPYAIGDIGPGGGRVFYDKGSYSADWRYLEVSPADLGVMQWGAAKDACRTYPNNEEIGWRLPTKNEITMLHDNYQTWDSTGLTFNSGLDLYWSSEVSGGGHFAGRIIGTSSFAGYINESLPVRAVRQF